MNKFNSRRRNKQKETRLRSKVKKKHLEMEGKTIVNGPPPTPVSGKRKRRLERRWRQAQKEALDSGLVTLQDIEMIAADQGGEGRMGEKSGEGSKKQKKVGSLLKKKGLVLRKKVRVRVVPKSNKDGKKGMTTDAAAEEDMETDGMATE